MRQQLARLIDDRWVPVKRRVSFAGGFSGSIMIWRNIGYRSPLRFAVHAVKRLISRVREREKAIRLFLNRRLRFGESRRDQP